MLDTLHERWSGQMPIVSESPILIVVEDDSTRWDLSCRLKSAGHTTELAENGEHAIDLFRQDPQDYAAIVIERQMSGLDGEETMSILRHIGCGSPAVYLDGELDMSELESAICAAV